MSLGIPPRAAGAAARRRTPADADAMSLHATAHSKAFRGALAAVERYAPYDDVTVLIEGEPGTGKTLLARHLHRHSPRTERGLHRVDLGTIDDSLSGSDLFGHVSGAFTGAQGRRVGHFLAAQGGTLFLDEIAKASKGVQQKLLHAIEYGEIVQVGADRPIPVDVRIVAATNVALEERVAAGDFLPDLLPRLSCFRVRVPALRERRADILPLTRAFVEAFAARHGYRDGPPEVDAALGAALESAPWPGNVRELEHAVRYLLVTAHGDPVLGLEHCTESLAPLRRGAAVVAEPLTCARLRTAIAAEGNVSAAARRLGISRQTIYRHLERDDRPNVVD